MARSSLSSANLELWARLNTSSACALDDLEALQLAGDLSPAEAVALIDEFGSLPEALAADVPALRRCVPVAQALRLALVRDLARRQLVAPLRQRPVLTGWTQTADYLRGILRGRPREQLHGLFLDRRNRLIRVHLTVNALGSDAERLSPRKADLEAWRQAFARRLRERGVAAEATPRRARGVTRKAERGPVRRLRERHQGGEGGLGKVAADKIREAARVAFGQPVEAADWDRRIAERQARVRRLYLAQAKLLQTSDHADDRELGRSVEAFVRSMAPPDTERLALARALRELNGRARVDQERGTDGSAGRAR